LTNGGEIPVVCRPYTGVKHSSFVHACSYNEALQEIESVYSVVHQR